MPISRYPSWTASGWLWTLQRWEANRYLGVRYDLERDTLSRITFAGNLNLYPVWTPDGQRIVYYSSEKGIPQNLWWIRADGGGNAQRLTESKNAQIPRSWSPDGRILTFFESSSTTSFDVMTMPVEGDEKSGWKPGQPKPFVNTAFNELLPAFSPNGKWIAYESDESGKYEVYVRPFPGPGGKWWQISAGGGSYPTWSRNGKELFYRGPDLKIMVAGYAESGDSFRADKPRVWSTGQFANRGATTDFSLAPDGKRFAVFKVPGSDAAPSAITNVNFIFNFFDELRAKVPAGKN